MEIPLLLQILTHGYAYTVTEADGSISQELVAPNKHMIAAAKHIQLLHANVDKLNQAYGQLMTERNALIAETENLREQLKSLQASNAPAGSSGEN